MAVHVRYNSWYISFVGKTLNSMFTRRCPRRRRRGFVTSFICRAFTNEFELTRLALYSAQFETTSFDLKCFPQHVRQVDI